MESASAPDVVQSKRSVGRIVLGAVFALMFLGQAIAIVAMMASESSQTGRWAAQEMRARNFVPKVVLGGGSLVTLGLAFLCFRRKSKNP